MNNNKLTSSKVCNALDISVRTLNAWYKWYYNQDIEKPPDTPYLPPYQQDSERGVRYWQLGDIVALKAFKQWVPKGRDGVMGAVNYKSWGARGERAMKNKKEG